ncbi:MAG: hypothetical protein IH840_12330, partial [Candidatus Heimdallarchaeota archaeon]|nr:hypothetical protein [Candidatus Heimdallarchaeota archaeon]
SFTDGVPFVAKLGNVIGIQAYPNSAFVNPGLEVLWDNAIQYLVSTPVPDTTSPTITNAPIDLNIAEGSTGNKLNWIATDDNPGTYSITRNGEPAGSDSWSSGVAIMLNIDGLGFGDHIYIITVLDNVGNSVSDTVVVTVFDSTLPTFTVVPTDFSYTEGSTGNTISWTATDTNPATYSITRTGLNPLSGSWSSGTAIILDIDGLGVGIYTFVITVLDLAGNSASDTVVVTVLTISDTTSPTVAGPIDFTYTEGSTGNSISWIATDANPATYSIERTGLNTLSGSWSSGTAIILDIDGLGVGIYTFVITVLDIAGNSASDTVVVTVLTISDTTSSERPTTSDEPTTSDKPTTSDEPTTSDAPTTSDKPDESTSTPPALPFPAGSIYLWLFSFLSVAVIVRRRR